MPSIYTVVFGAWVPPLAFSAFPHGFLGSHATKCSGPLLLEGFFPAERESRIKNSLHFLIQTSQLLVCILHGLQGPRLACFGQGPCCSLLATNCHYLEVFLIAHCSKVFEVYHDLIQSWNFDNFHGSNSNHDLPTEKAFGPPKFCFQASIK